MIIDSVFLEGSMTKIYSLNTLIIGGGAAGLKAAVSLYDKGVEDIAVITDRSDGSVSSEATADRQNYYVLNGSGKRSDSALKMASDLTKHHDVDGDLAFTEAAVSQKCFSFLCDQGLPHAEGEYGETISYGNDPQNDRSLRLQNHASGQIEAVLKKEAARRGICILNNYQLVQIFKDPEHNYVRGALILNKSGVRDRYQRFVLFNCTNIILASGGPGGLYARSAYPPTHAGALGLALESGAEACSVYSMTFGVCALNQPLMLNGGFVKALPKVFSVNAKGEDRTEFLLPYFPDTEELFRIMKRKGDHWAFDAKALSKRHDRSSLFDLLIYNEIIHKGRHVFFDYTENPTGLSDLLLPYERLKDRYPEAYTAFLDFDFDPSDHPIEVSVSMIHHNGGIATDHHFESSISHLFAVGEAAGSNGYKLQAGESLNQTQVSAYRAATHIADKYLSEPSPVDQFIAAVRSDFSSRVKLADTFLANQQNPSSFRNSDSIRALKADIGYRMDRSAGIYLDKGRLEHELSEALVRLRSLTIAYIPSSQVDLSTFFRNYDLLISQIAVLSGMLDYIKQGGNSRGSCLLYAKAGELPHENLNEMYRHSTAESSIQGKIQLLSFDPKTFSCTARWREVHPIPIESI